MALAIINLILCFIVLLFFSGRSLEFNILINFFALVGIIGSILCFGSSYLLIGFIIVSVVYAFVLVLPSYTTETFIFKCFVIFVLIANLFSIFQILNIFPELKLI